MTATELTTARNILEQTRKRITEAANDDLILRFALRRYIYKYLMYDERGTPAQRTKLKLEKLIEQDGRCAYLHCLLPDRKLTKGDEPELDRIDPVVGYTSENTLLMHHECHRHSQRAKGYA